MKIKSLKTLVGSYGSLAKGEVRDIQKSTAVELIALGYAEDVSDPSDAAEEDTVQAEDTGKSDVPETPVISHERVSKPKQKGKPNGHNEGS